MDITKYMWSKGRGNFHCIVAGLGVDGAMAAADVSRMGGSGNWMFAVSSRSSEQRKLLPAAGRDFFAASGQK